MEKFLPFVDLFQKESVKVEVCKSILQAFARVAIDQTDNSILSSALLYVARVRLAADHTHRFCVIVLHVYWI